MKKSSFRPIGLNQAQRKQLTIDRFYGVDYSSQKFLISTGHAIDLKNYIFKDGIVQTRDGIEQKLSVPDFEYFAADFSVPTQALDKEIRSNKNCKTFNGIWIFTGEDNKEHIIAHVGKLLYEIKNIASQYIEIIPLTLGKPKGEIYDLAFEFLDYKSSAFVGGKKLWFFGGNKYICLRFYGENSMDIFQVEDSPFTPIPTTSISITYKNSLVNRRTGLDSVNLLTKWRKNQLISGTTKNEDEKTKTVFYEYTLDAPLIVKSAGDMAEISVTLEEQGELNNGI